jgi:hypothetical protein
MEDPKTLQHQLDLATRAAAATRDETTAGRFRRFADELRLRLFTSSRHRQITARAFELWDQAGRPTGRDLDFWLAAEREITTQRQQQSGETGSPGDG